METPPSYSSCITFDDGGGGSSPGSAGGSPGKWFSLRRDRILREMQDMVNLYNECFLCLQDAIADVDILREDNLKLASENLELSFLVDEMEAATVRGPGVRSHLLGDAKAGEGKGAAAGKAAVIGGLPKSISIRSPGFLTVKHPSPGSGDGEQSRPHRLRVPTSSVVQGGEEDEESESGSGVAGSVEVDVYEQGTTKTELCNKWGEMGRCPYGDRCRFAHGIEELRPVIRHPRYKTQLCRMVGDCPYGHRCHFRHAALPDPHAP